MPLTSDRSLSNAATNSALSIRIVPGKLAKDPLLMVASSFLMAFSALIFSPSGNAACKIISASPDAVTSVTSIAANAVRPDVLAWFRALSSAPLIEIDNWASWAASPTTGEMVTLPCWTLIPPKLAVLILARNVVLSIDKSALRSVNGGNWSDQPSVVSCNRQLPFISCSLCPPLSAS